MRNRIGRPVRGQDFFGRSQDLRRLWRKLDGDHILLSAPRRVGKTSLVIRACDIAPEHGFQGFWVTVEGITEEWQFVERLFQALSKHPELRSRMKSILGSLQSFLELFESVQMPGGIKIGLGERGRTEWRRAGEDLAKVLGQLEGRWLIGVDEVPLFINSWLQAGEVSRTREFLSWFRALRQEHEHLHWLLAGSIGLDTVSDRFNLGHNINDLHVMELGAFDQPEAHRCLQALSEEHSIPLTEEVRSYIIDRIGWPIPYYLQLIFGELRDHFENATEPPTVEAAEEAFERLLSTTKGTYFGYWRQRLLTQLGVSSGDQAIALLSVICRDQRGVERASLLQALALHIGSARQRESDLHYLLGVLEHDGYLVEQGRRFQFRFPLLREYWLRRTNP